MKKNTKKLILLMAVAITAMLCLAFSTSALDATGQCGDNVSWTYNASTGELVISGTGDMYSYSNYYNHSPFENSDIKSVSIENGVTSIGDSAFWGCTSLASITIPDVVTSIGNSAFRDCTSLTSITIPDSVTHIGRAAFGGTGYYNNESNWHDKALYNGKFLLDVKDDISGSFSIKKGTTVIADSSFYYTDNLTKVTIPDSVKIISDSAFMGCHKLGSIVIPYGVTSIEHGAFWGCAIDSITIPGSVTSIGEEAFRTFPAMKEVTIPDSVVYIGDEAFGYGLVPGYDGMYRVKNSNFIVKGGKGSAAEKYAADNEFAFTVIANTHTYKTTTTKATLTANGKTVTKCSVCGEVKSSKIIYYPKTITLSKTAYTYNGKAKTPSVTVKDSKGNTLKNGTDYKVTYEKGRKNPGKYTVRLDFIGNYSGTKRVYFTIAPSTPAITKTAQSTDAIRLTWNKVTGATGYRVYQYNSKTKKYEKIKTLKGTTYRVEKLKSGTAYKFKIKAYIKDGDTIWGKATDAITVATKPATPKITKLTTSKGKAVFTWSDVSGESGYQVYCSTKKDSGFKKVASYKANVVKGLKSNLKSGKKYYFKVRAYKTVGETKVYSAWSAVKAVKIK